MIRNFLLYTGSGYDKIINTSKDELFMISKDFFTFDGSFKNQDTENEFLQENWRKQSRKIRIILIVTAIAYLTGIHGDYLAFKSTSPFFTLLALRLLSLTFAVFAVCITFQAKGKDRIQSCIFLYFIVIAATECTELYLKPGLEKLQLPFILLIMIGYFLFFNGKLVYVLISELIGAGSYVSILALKPSTPEETISPVIMTFLFVIFLSIYFTRYLYKSQRTEYYVLREHQDLNRQLKTEIEKRKKIQNKLQSITGATSTILRIKN